MLAWQQLDACLLHWAGNGYIVKGTSSRPLCHCSSIWEHLHARSIAILCKTPTGAACCCLAPHCRCSTRDWIREIDWIGSGQAAWLASLLVAPHSSLLSCSTKSTRAI